MRKITFYSLIIFFAVCGGFVIFGHSVAQAADSTDQGDTYQIPADKKTHPYFPSLKKIAMNGLPKTVNANTIVNTSPVQISVNTRVPAYCRYSLGIDRPYWSMTDFSSTGHYFHTAQVAINTDGFQNVYAKCRDTYGNVDMESLTWQFYFDLLAPNIIAHNPPDETYGPFNGGWFYSPIKGSAYQFWAVFDAPDVQRVKFDWWDCSMAVPTCLKFTDIVEDTTFAPNKKFSAKTLLDTKWYDDNWAYHYVDITAYDYSGHSTNRLIRVDIDNTKPGLVGYPPSTNPLMIAQGSSNGQLHITFNEPDDEYYGAEYDSCPNDGARIDSDCKVTNRYIKYVIQEPDNENNPFQTEADFWAASDLNYPIVPWPGVPSPQRINTPINITANFPPNKNVFIAVWAKDEIGNMQPWEYVQYYSVGHMLTPLRNVELTNPSCVKYDSYNIPHLCTSSGYYKSGIGYQVGEINMYLYDPLIVSGLVNNNGNIEENITYRLQSDAGNQNQEFSFAPFQSQNINMTWYPTISNNFVFAYNDIAEWHPCPVGSNCYTLFSNLPVFSIRQIGTLGWYSSTTPPTEIIPGTDFFVKVDTSYTNPREPRDIWYKEIPYKISITNPDNSDVDFNVIKFNDPTGSSPHCLNNDKLCYMNVVGGPSNTIISPYWKIQGLPQGIYNVSVKIGNDGDEKTVDQTIYVGVTPPGSASLKSESSNLITAE